MAICNKCGATAESNATFCPICGAALEAIPTQPPVQQPKVDLSEKFEQFSNTPDVTEQFTAEDINQNKVMAILAYFGPLCLIPIIAAKDSKFARFHVNQGLVLFIAMIAYSIICTIVNSILLAISWRLAFISSILGVVSIFFAILAILGIINAANGKAKELPIIGKIKIIK